MNESLYDLEVETLAGDRQTLGAYRDNVLLVVNTASKCGFTPQYEGLETLFQRFGERGLVVLGFPCNQFGRQESGTHDEIAAFCQRNYGVSFPMHTKIEVNGKNAHPLFVHLKKAAPGLLGSGTIKWNFTKFLVDREGASVRRFPPTAKPEALAEQIETLLE